MRPTQHPQPSETPLKTLDTSSIHGRLHAGKLDRNVDYVFLQFGQVIVRSFGTSTQISIMLIGMKQSMNPDMKNFEFLSAAQL